jgi:NAD(P)-dependent dehydrogenase (short-subunit alcohol dehydrogenase family)
MTEVRSVLITGCSSGIGRHLAEGLRAQGYRVFATARKQDDVDALTDCGLESLMLDLNDSTSIHAAVVEVLQRGGGRLYALINNAGYGQPGAVEDLSRAVLREQFETNLFGLMELTNQVLPAMRAQGYGRIINISSLLGLFVLRYRGAYNASKFALEGLTDTLRLELQGSGISISLIEPGPILSKFRLNALLAYKKNINIERSAHRAFYLVMEQRLTKQGPAVPFTLGPQAVLDKVNHALNSVRPKIRYYVTIPTYFVAMMRRLLPYRALDWLAEKLGRA